MKSFKCLDSGKKIIKSPYTTLTLVYNLLNDYLPPSLTGSIIWFCHGLDTNMVSRGDPVHNSFEFRVYLLLNWFPYNH